MYIVSELILVGRDFRAWTVGLCEHDTEEEKPTEQHKHDRQVKG